MKPKNTQLIIPLIVYKIVRPKVSIMHSCKVSNQMIQNVLVLSWKPYMPITKHCGLGTKNRATFFSTPKTRRLISHGQSQRPGNQSLHLHLWHLITRANPMDCNASLILLLVSFHLKDLYILYYFLGILRLYLESVFKNTIVKLF